MNEENTAVSTRRYQIILSCSSSHRLPSLFLHFLRDPLRIPVNIQETLSLHPFNIVSSGSTVFVLIKFTFGSEKLGLS